MRIVIAPDSFKGVLDARSVARAIEEGVRRAMPLAEIIRAPMADGGEGTLDILVDALQGQRRRLRTTGPTGQPVESSIGLVRDAATAVIESAQVIGYHLVPPERRDPLRTTTLGLGQVIRTTIETGVDEIILGLGGSATVDGGAGMMQGLGFGLVDESGRDLSRGAGGGVLGRISNISWAGPPDLLADVQFTIACDVLNPACGPNGAAAIFGPQKGASPRDVEILENGLSHWADLLEREADRDLRNEPGAGAAGAVALPLLAFANATLVPGVDLVGQAINLTESISEADLVITGEGRLDRQSMMGKVVGAVGRMAHSAGVSCVAIVGTTGDGAEDCLEVIDRFHTLDCDMERTPERLAETGELVAREQL